MSMWHSNGTVSCWRNSPAPQESTSMSQGNNVSLSALIHGKSCISVLFKPSVHEDVGVGLEIPWQKDGGVSIHLSHLGPTILSGEK